MLVRVAGKRGARPVARVGHLVRMRSFGHQRRPLLQLAREKRPHLCHASLEAPARLRVAEAGVDPGAVGAFAGEEARHDHAVVGRVEAGVGARLGLLPACGEGVGFVVTRREALLSVRVRVRVRVGVGAGERVRAEARVKVRIRARVRVRVGLGLASPALRLRAARQADPWAASP